LQSVNWLTQYNSVARVYLPLSGSFIIGIVWPLLIFCSLSKNSDVDAICRSASTPSYDLFLTIDFGGNCDDCDDDIGILLYKQKLINYAINGRA